MFSKKFLNTKDTRVTKEKPYDFAPVFPLCVLRILCGEKEVTL